MVHIMHGCALSMGKYGTSLSYSAYHIINYKQKRNQCKATADGKGEYCYSNTRRSLIR